MDSIKIDKIIRSRRRTLSISVNNTGHLIVRAPLPLDDHAIIDFINKKRDWVDKRKKTARMRMARIKPKVFTDGEEFKFMGRNHQLRLTSRDQIRLSEYLEFPIRFLPKAHDFLLRWYKLQAFTKIGERVKFYGKIMGSKPESIKITSAKTRWGSCSRENKLNFSWRLIMAPLSVIDYVVVHELVHIREKNHSYRFWDKVSDFLPQYKERRKWLRANGYLLVI